MSLPQPAESESPVTFPQMLHALWKRKLTVAVSVVVAVAACLAYAGLATPTYQSSALIQINTPSTTGSGTSTSPFTLPDPVQELSSTGVQLAAAATLHDLDPRRWTARSPGRWTPPAVR